ncbi:uncharacterized protein EHS24_009070 [Apiotrichum porosum]|uniref:Uncharacterized protein n=1 Tax=Apiotrichum porosum TaxID=105984 RepID=A0A427XNS7_9TREE|nr:uncharacterized protein EHS24_009070 [Apiotrichum porosum]RSH80490.1 hypothetical protein EHS24_009070 [Apiotrichum porosum]
MLPAVDPYGVHMRAMCGDRNDDAENENARAPPDPWLAARYVPDMQDALQHVQVLDLGHVRDLDEAAALGVRAATVRILTVSIFSVHHTQQRGWHSWHNPRAAAAPVPTWPTDLAPTRLVLWVSVPFESGVPLRLRRLRRLVLVLTYGWECSAWDPAALDLDVGEGGIPEIVVQCHKRPTETVCGCISHPSDSAGLSAMLEPLMGPDTRLTLIDPPRDGPLPDAEVIPLDMWNRDADPVEISWEGIHGDRVWRPWIGCRRRAVE